MPLQPSQVKSSGTILQGDLLIPRRPLPTRSSMSVRKMAMCTHLPVTGCGVIPLAEASNPCQRWPMESSMSARMIIACMPLMLLLVRKCGTTSLGTQSTPHQPSSTRSFTLARRTTCSTPSRPAQEPGCGALLLEEASCLHQWWPTGRSSLAHKITGFMHLM